MRSDETPPSVDAAKRQAKRLREALTARGEPISVAESLELLSHIYGYHDWNTLRAVVCRDGTPLSLAGLGARITGTYTGRPISGRVRAFSWIGETFCRIGIELDDAIDVVTFESFSAIRTRLNFVMDRQGRSHSKDGNGKPLLVIETVTANA